MAQADFIGVYPNVLSEEFCTHLLQKFDNCTHKHPGLTSGGVDPKKKDSLDLNITSHPAWQDESRELTRQTILGLVPYVREYPFFLVGTMSFEIMDPKTRKIRNITHREISGLSDQLIAQMILKVFRLGSVNLQKYKKGQGGYHQWHSELVPSPLDPKGDDMHRVLLWMYYLNDVEEGGETRFYHQEKAISPRRGTMVVAPAGFTHTHKGSVPISHDKYILTSWVLYLRAEDLYRG